LTLELVHVGLIPCIFTYIAGFVLKKITKPMIGFKVFLSAKATPDVIETPQMIRKGQLSDEK